MKDRLKTQIKAKTKYIVTVMNLKEGKRVKFKYKLKSKTLKTKLRPSKIKFLF